MWGRFTAFAAACRGVSPLYATLAERTAGDEAVTGLLAAAPPRERRASLLFAAVHYLLLSGVDDPLAAFYPSVSKGRTNGDPTGAFVDFCQRRADDLRTILATRRAQPNEVQRCAVLLPALALASRRFSTAMILVDIGAGAGLNLLFDRFGYHYPPHGSVGSKNSPVQLSCQVLGSTRPPLPGAPPAVAHRIGTDERVLDVADPEDVLWVRACAWPDRPEARAQIEGAIEFARASPLTLVAGHALDVVPQVVARQPRDAPVCVLTAATLPYLDVNERRELAATLGRLADDHELAWVTFEGPRQSPVARSGEKNAGGTTSGGFLGLTDFRQAEGELLARARMHGNWLEWVGRRH
jgi:hypothetical protein